MRNIDVTVVGFRQNQGSDRGLIFAASWRSRSGAAENSYQVLRSWELGLSKPLLAFCGSNAAKLPIFIWIDAYVLDGNPNRESISRCCAISWGEGARHSRRQRM